jgi:hypothetical protein
MLIFSVAVLGGGGSSLAEHVLGLVEDGWDKLSTTSAITSPKEGRAPVNRKGAGHKNRHSTHSQGARNSQTDPQCSVFFFPSLLGLYGQQPANQVIIRERYRDNDSDLALGMLAGAATGMALGSLFWVF